MNTSHITEVANEDTGLFIAIFTAEEYNAEYHKDYEGGYVAVVHRDGFEHVGTLAEAISIATDWAKDAVYYAKLAVRDWNEYSVGDHPSEDIEALTEFIVELSVIEALHKGEAWSTADIEDAILKALDTEEATDETDAAAYEMVRRLMSTGLYFRTGPDQRIMVK